MGDIAVALKISIASDAVGGIIAVLTLRSKLAETCFFLKFPYQ